MTNIGLGRKPLLAVVASRPSGDGVGYVGLLLRRVFQETWGDFSFLALDAARPTRVKPSEAARFAARLLLAQIQPRPLPVLFNHLGIARAQLALPSVLRRPYAVFLNGVEIWDPALNAERKMAVRQAALRIAISRYTAERVMRTHPDLGRVVSCPLALLPGEPQPSDEDIVNASAKLPAGPRVVIVGRMSAAERYKGHDELIESWPLVRQAVPNAYLVIIGRGDDLTRLRGRAHEIGIGDSVLFTGFLEDVAMRATVAACEVFAMPSRGEGFGLVYLEAMRLGVPCVASDADAASEVIEHGRTGMITPSGNREALAATLVRFLVDRGLRTRMADAARERERTVFSYSRFREGVAAEMERVAHTLQSTTSIRGRGHDAPASDS